ncbi:MAG TPA: alternative ribosome rescue aminoacyl-tRNA hydrolase ArfB [Candidatus Polarisedimenticolia bacterium]|jgi:ribosome-associated protein|nr:alternative ribosome rescue aminoacyl-tRNA hydrolase ArfB [Candidatus Polarisedimenticolia bacterium]
MIRILPGLSIPEEELVFSASRSGGPGGQNVNKVNSRVTLRFDVRASPSLSSEQKRRILSKLATRVNSEGMLRVVSQKSRSQAINRDAAEVRFAELLRGALTSPKVRKKTGIPASRRHSRLEEKRHHSEIKRDRIWRSGGDE